MKLTVIDLRDDGKPAPELIARDGTPELTCYKVMLAMSLIEKMAGGADQVYAIDFDEEVNGHPAIVCGYMDRAGQQVPLVAVAPMTAERWAELCPVPAYEVEDVS